MKRLLRISLSTLLVLSVCAAIGLVVARLAADVRERQALYRTAQPLEAMGAHVTHLRDWHDELAALLGSDASGVPVGVWCHPNHIRASMDGDMLAALAEVTTLRELTLIKIGVTDEGLAQVGRLIDLEELAIHGGEMTDTGLAHLAQLTELKELALVGNDDHSPGITSDGMRFPGQLRKLQRLELHRLHIDQLAIPHLSQLDQLERLWISDTDVSSLDGIEALPRLRWLSLFGTTISDDGMSALAGMSSLEALDVNSPQIGPGTLQHLSKLHNLEALYLADAQIGDEHIAMLSGLTKLHRLSLPGTNITDRGVGELAKLLPQLEDLNLSRTGVTDACLDSIATFPALTYVTFEETHISDEAAARLQQRRPNLTISITPPRELSTRSKLP